MIRTLSDQIDMAYSRMAEECCVTEDDEVLEILTTGYDRASGRLRKLEEEFEIAFLEKK